MPFTHPSPLWSSQWLLITTSSHRWGTGVWRVCLEPRGRRTECDWSWVFPELESVISSYSMATVMPAADQILHMLLFQSWTGGQAFWKQFSLKHISLSLGALWLVTSCPPAAGSHGLGITNFSFFSGQSSNYWPLGPGNPWEKSETPFVNQTLHINWRWGLCSHRKHCGFWPFGGRKTEYCLPFPIRPPPFVPLHT